MYRAVVFLVPCAYALRGTKPSTGKEFEGEKERTLAAFMKDYDAIEAESQAVDDGKRGSGTVCTSMDLDDCPKLEKLIKDEPVTIAKEKKSWCEALITNKLEPELLATMDRNGWCKPYLPKK